LSTPLLPPAQKTHKHQSGADQQEGGDFGRGRGSAGFEALDLDLAVKITEISKEEAANRCAADDAEELGSSVGGNRDTVV